MIAEPALDFAFAPMRSRNGASARELRAFAAVVLGGVLFGASCGGGGGGSGGPPPISSDLSTLTVDHPFGVPADGLSSVEITATVVDTSGTPMAGVEVEFRSSGVGNTLSGRGVTDASGVATGTIATSVAERKTLTAIADPDLSATELRAATTEFVRFRPHRFYVRSGGSDANTGNLPLKAWRTLGHALAQVGPGDTVYVGAGLYEPIDISIAAAPREPLLLRADPQGIFTGDAGEVVIDASGSPYGIRFSGATQVAVRGFTILGATGAGILSDSAANEGCSIVECSIRENERAVELRAGRSFLLQGNRISRNASHGIVCVDTELSRFVHNLVYENGARGVSIQGNSPDLFIAVNTFYRNAGDQMRETVAGSTGVIRDNVVSEGLEDGIELAPDSELRLASNLAWANDGAGYLVPGGLVAPSNHTGDPRFVDPFGADGILGGNGDADDDFRMDGTSAAIDRSDIDARNLLLDFQGSVSSLTSRNDEEFDGRGSDGVQANFGFHYPVQLDALDSLGARGARASWILPNDLVLRSVSYDPLTREFGAKRAAQATNRDAPWVLQRVSPVLQADEFAAVLADTGTVTHLFVRHFDGTRWQEEGTMPVSAAIQSRHAGERGFDLEIESTSGEALLVFSTDGPVPSFRSFTEGAWNETLPAYDPALGTGTILWVELVADPNSDRMLLVTLDDEQKLVAAPWNGNAWDAPILLDTQIVQLRDYKAFDAAFEGNSGDALVAWGFSGFAEQTRFATWRANTGAWTFGTHASTDAVGAHLVLASDPTSDRIVGGFGEGPFDVDVVVAIWDGTTWTHNAEVSLKGEPGQRAIEVGWIGNTGHAFAVWSNQDSAATLHLALWEGAWRVKPPVSLPGVAPILQAEARSLPGENRVLALLLDEAGALFGASFDGASWSLENGGRALETGFDPATATTPFSFDLRRR